jgi:porphobilinogen synthase
MRKFRNLRESKAVRDRYAETKLSAQDFILPFFVTHGKNMAAGIPGFGPVKRYSSDTVVKAAGEAYENGINKILLFGTVDEKYKNPEALHAVSGLGPVEAAVANIKKHIPGITVITDVCLCAYTDHGHCGIIRNNKVDNELTLPYLSKMAVSHAASGADYVAPSAMMDGQVRAIRKALDSAGFTRTGIIGYSAKFASAFYGPFRNAAGSSPSFGDRKTYQMDYRNLRQAVAEIAEDIKEGAEVVMVKPASHYLDVVRQARNEFKKVKIAAYQVSGEYMMIKIAAQKKLIDEKQAVLESLYSIKRAGADLIITYFAQEAAQWL